MFKRNQLEEAIALVYEPGLTKSTSEIRTQLKRLLETDRSLGRNKRSSDPERAHFAFYSVDTPGRGTENCFSEYEAFALLTCLRLMRHGWPQARAVALLRRVRAGLEKHHARILKQDPASLFDQFLIRQRAKPGTLAVDNTDPVFLVIASRDQQGRSSTNSAAICRGRLTVWCWGGQFRTNRISPQTNRERTGERHGYRPGNRAKRRLGGPPNLRGPIKPRNQPGGVFAPS